MRNVDLYGILSQVVTDKIRARRMRLAGHHVRHSKLAASNLVLLELKYGTRSRGRLVISYIDILRRDTGLNNTEKIRTLPVIPKLVLVNTLTST